MYLVMHTTLLSGIQIHFYINTVYFYTFDTNIPLSFGSRGFPIVDLVPPLILTPNLAEADFLITITWGGHTIVHNWHTEKDVHICPFTK